MSDRLYFVPGTALDFLSSGKVALREARPAPAYPLRPEWRHHREAALDNVDRLLDDLCLKLGLDPEITWRQPSAYEERARRDDAMFRARVGMAIAAGVIDPRQCMVISIT